MKIRIDPLDVLFSKYIRLRANGKCDRCLKPKDFKQLQTAHCWGRRKKSVRWDKDNARGICFYCHRMIDSEDPEAKRELFTRYLGEDGYRKLNQRANWPQQYKPDKKAIKLLIESDLIELNENNPR